MRRQLHEDDAVAAGDGLKAAEADDVRVPPERRHHANLLAHRRLRRPRLVDELQRERLARGFELGELDDREPAFAEGAADGVLVEAAAGAVAVAELESGEETGRAGTRRESTARGEAEAGQLAITNEGGELAESVVADALRDPATPRPEMQPTGGPQSPRMSGGKEEAEQTSVYL